MAHGILLQEDILETWHCCIRADWLMKAHAPFSLNSRTVCLLSLMALVTHRHLPPPDKSEEGIKFLWHKFTSFRGHMLVTSIENTVSLLLNCTKIFVSFLQDIKGIKKEISNSGVRDTGVRVSFTH